MKPVSLVTVLCLILLIWAGTLIFAGCSAEWEQSALTPAGPAARTIERLWWVLFWICTAVFVAVVVLTGIAIRRRRRSDAPLGDVFIVVSGMVIPAVILIVLLVLTLRNTVALRAPEQLAFNVRITGHQWWWEVQYLENGIVTANEIHVPVGQAVGLDLRAADVIHSFWVPNLSGKIDLIPGQPNRYWIRADSPGVYRGQCAEYCGTQHANMALFVIALPPEEYESWAASRSQPAEEPTNPQVARGKEVFFDAACGNCHAIRGTKATASIGPDLTHIASRRTIGAGLLPNNRGNLAGWVMNPQLLKPGNKMPPSYLRSEDLHALLEYLESLR